jgi:SAM-dependent methyltransferase
MSITGDRYLISYDPLDQQVNFEGSLRAVNQADLDAIRDYLSELHQKLEGTMRLNFRKLRYLNSAGLRVIIDFLKSANQARKLDIQLIGSKVVAWEEKTLTNLPALGERIGFQVFDRNFYESQGIIEDAQFIPLLRNQTRLLWPLEREVLVQHGLREGLRVADICCGCGDVALLIARDLKPSVVLGIDHSLPAIEYATRLAKEFKVRNADFRLGDATALMLEDEQFDFVLCRLSIQIFSRPELILKELHRILKPGGRLYLIGEDYDLIVGYPNDRDIRTVYDAAGKYGQAIGMDLYNGKKLYSILSGLRLGNIRLDYLDVDTVNSDRQVFAEMIKSWRHFSAQTIGRELGIAGEAKASLEAGYDAHLRTIQHPFGYTKWTVVAASGEKR